MEEFSGMKAFEERLRALGEDNASGARELAEKAAVLFFDLLRSRKKVSQERLVHEVAAISNRLLDLQPSIGPLFNLTNGLLRLLETRGRDFHPVEAGKEWLSLFRRRLSRNVEELRRRAADLLPDKGVVLTYSYSSTVAETLVTARKLGKHVRVLCSEGRPNLEGRRLARELSEAGLHVRFGVDAALFGWIEAADLLLFGGDALSRRGLLNKVGTAGLVACAHELGRSGAEAARPRIYALADTEKLIPTGLAGRLRISSRDRAEVLETAQNSVEVLNRYFDLTPLDQLDGIITESGLESSKDLLERADEAPVSARLLPSAPKAARRKLTSREIVEGLRAPLSP